MTCSRATHRCSATYISRAVCPPCHRPLPLGLGAIQAHLVLERRHKAHCLRQHPRRCPSCSFHSVLFLFCPCPAQPPQHRLRHQILYVFPLLSRVTCLPTYLLSSLTLLIRNSHLPVLFFSARACAAYSRLVQRTRSLQAHLPRRAVRVTCTTPARPASPRAVARTELLTHGGQATRIQTQLWHRVVVLQVSRKAWASVVGLCDQEVERCSGGRSSPHHCHWMMTKHT